jgi:hypothetical protein
MTDPAPDALRRLEERLSQASEAAERLMQEAARGARRSEPSGAQDRPPPSGAQDRPPPAGWQTADAQGPPSHRGELETLLAALGSLRELIPPEVLARLAAALRELLLALRALIDVYAERLEGPRSPADEVRDIPID